MKLISVFLLVGLVGTASAADCTKSWSTTALAAECACKQGPIGMYVSGANPQNAVVPNCPNTQTCTGSTIVGDTQRVKQGGTLYIETDANAGTCTTVKCSNTDGTVKRTGSKCKCPSGNTVSERSSSLPTKCEGSIETIGAGQSEVNIDQYCIGSNFYNINKKTSGDMTSGNQATQLTYQGTSVTNPLCDNNIAAAVCTCHAAGTYHTGGAATLQCAINNYCMKLSGFVYNSENTWDGVETNKNVISAQTRCMKKCTPDAKVTEACVCAGTGGALRNVAGVNTICKASGIVEMAACTGADGTWASKVTYIANGPFKNNGCKCGGTDVCTHGQYCDSTLATGAKCRGIPKCGATAGAAVISLNSAATCTCGTITCVVGQTCATGACTWSTCDAGNSYASATQVVSNNPFNGAVTTNPGTTASFGGEVNSCMADIKKCVCSQVGGTTKNNCGNNQVCDTSTGTCQVPACEGEGKVTTYACQCPSKETDNTATYNQCSVGQACHTTTTVVKTPGLCGLPICLNNDGNAVINTPCACPTAKKANHNYFTAGDYTTANPGQACYIGTALKAGKVGLVNCGSIIGRNPQDATVVGKARFGNQYTSYNSYSYESGTGTDRKLNPVSCSCGESTALITTTATCSFGQMCDVDTTKPVAKCWTPLCQIVDGSAPAFVTAANTKGAGYSCICPGGPKAIGGALSKGADVTCSGYQRCFGGMAGRPATGTGNTAIGEVAATAARCGCMTYNKHEADGNAIPNEQLYSKHKNDKCVDTYTKWDFGAEHADCTCIGGSGSGSGKAGADTSCDRGEVCVIGACATAMNGAGGSGECFDSASEVAASVVALAFAGVVSMFA